MKEQVEKIASKDDFVDFVEILHADLKNNSEGWENKTLLEYLDAIASWTEDMDGYYINNNMEPPKEVPWKVFANILIAAKMYE